MTGNITVLDLETYGGRTLEQLGERVIEKFAVSKTPEISERWLRKTFGLADNLPREQALRQQVAENIARYRKELPEKTRAFSDQADHCVRIALQWRYLTTAPGFTLVITDDLLHRGLPGDAYCLAPSPNICVYAAERNTIYVAHPLPNVVVAHEVGHALSLRQEQRQSGFLRLQPRPDGRWQRLGNKWLDEGTTVLWEELSVNDGSTLPSRRDPDDAYCWYREATLALLQELSLDQETALAAYFGGHTARAVIAMNVIRRFGCTLDDLQRVALYQKIGFTRQLLHGEPVEHKIRTGHVRVQPAGILVTEKPDRQLADDWRQLATIFPNLTLIKPKE